MNIRDLKYLIALAEYGHFGQAAKACFVSQPALSMQIQKLEETLGIKLLERSRKSVLLTSHGEMVVTRARSILSEIEAIQQFAKLAVDPYHGKLTIGIIPTLAPYLLPHVFFKITQKFSRLNIFLVEEQTEHLIEKLKQGKLDAAFLADSVGETDLQSAGLFDEEFLLTINTENPLAKRKTVKLNDLENKKLLLLEEGHCLRTQILDLCQTFHMEEIQGFRATSLETLRYMVMSGAGITLLPKLACMPHKNLLYIPFKTPKPTRKIGLFWRNSSVKQILLQDIVNHIKKILSHTLLDLQIL